MKTVPLKPRTKELSWKLIARLTADIDLLEEAVEKISSEAQEALMLKDKDRIERCKKCKRGMSYD